MEKFGGRLKYWRTPTATGNKSHITMHEPKSGGVVYTLCGRGLRYRGNPRKEEMTEVRGTECMNCMDSLRAFQAQELASQERMRIFRNIPRKPSLDRSSSDKPSVEESTGMEEAKKTIEG